MPEMTREQWLEARTKGLGGTDCANIIVNAADPHERAGCWKGSLFEMWSTKMKLSPPGGASSSAAKRGQIMEEYVCRMYQDHLGPDAKLIEQGLTWHPKRKHIFGTPDRLVEVDGVRFGMDAKTRRSTAGWGDDGTCVLPLDTEIQCRVYMEIFDAPYWDVATLFGLDDFRVYRLERDEKLNNDILDLCEDWFDRHVGGEMPPEVDGSERAKKVIGAMHPRALVEDLREATADERELHRTLLEVRKDHKALSERKDELENQLRATIGDDIGIRGIATWKSSKPRTRLDEKAFKEAEPEKYSEYCFQSIAYRTLRILGEKKS